MTVVTCLALCAIIENAVVPELVGHAADAGPDSPAGAAHHKHGALPDTPAGKLTKAVDKAVTKRLADAARAAYGKSASRPVVRFSRRDRRRAWAFGASALPTPAGSAAIPEAALFVAHRSGKKWSIGVGGTPQFRHLVARAPAAVLPAAQRRALTRYAAGYFPGSSTGGTGTDTGLALPWRKGSAWTFAGATAGALAFTKGDGVVRAAGAGRLYRLCSHGLVMVVHPNGLATEYAQVTDVPSVPDGTYVARGAYLGHVGTQAPCRSAHAPARLRFALRDADTLVPVNGLRLGAWTMHARGDRTWATCAGERVNPGGRLPNEPAPKPAASPGATASPVRTPTATPDPTTPSPTTPSPEVLK